MHNNETDALREKTRDQLMIQRQLGTALRELLEDALAAPMPDRLRRLVGELDGKANGCRGEGGPMAAFNDAKG